MFKIVFLILIIVIGYIAYVGIDVSTEYDSVYKIRNQIFDNVIDPIIKKILKQASESDFNLIVDNTIKNMEKYN